MRAILSAVFLIILTLGAGVYASRWSAERELEALLVPVRQLASIQDYYVKQVKFWRERVSRDPYDFISARKLASTLMTQARACGNDSLYTEARLVLEQARQHTPKGDPETEALFARAIMAGHRFGEARQIAAELIAGNPDAKWLHELLGDALWGLGDYHAALLEYGKMEEQTGFSGSVRHAQEAWLKGDIHDERFHLLAALKIHRDFYPEPAAWIRLRLGMLELNEGNLVQAEKFFRASLAVAPDYYLGLEHLAEVHEKRGEFAEAEPLLREAIAINRDGGLIARLAKVCAALGKSEEATKLMAEAAGILKTRAYDGTRSHLRDYAQWLLDQKSSPEEALRLAVEDLSIRPGDLHSLATAARAFELNGRADEANFHRRQAHRFGTRGLL